MMCCYDDKKIYENFHRRAQNLSFAAAVKLSSRLLQAQKRKVKVNTAQAENKTSRKKKLENFQGRLPLLCE